MTIRERNQNPVLGSTIRLRLFTFNANLPTDVSISKVDIYLLDTTNKTIENPDGRVLVTTITSVVQDAEGQYHVDLPLTAPAFGIGNYLDVWSFADETQEKRFTVYPDLWYSATKPVVYDFNFSFSPNRLVLGSKRPIRIQITPVVPTGIILDEYYESLAIVSSLSVSIAKKCGECVPEGDDALIVDNEPTIYSDKVFAYYLVDTTDDSDYDFDVGIYDIWFTLEIGGNVYISEKHQFVIHC